MGHVVPIADDTDAAISAIAASQGATADTLIAEWLAEKLEDERRIALVDAAAAASPARTLTASTSARATMPPVSVSAERYPPDNLARMV